MQPIQGPEDTVIFGGHPVMARFVTDHQKINPGLAEMLLAERRVNPSPSTSSVGGWQSNTDLAVRGNHDMSILLDWIGQAVSQLTSMEVNQDINPGECHLSIHAWGNIMDDGDMTDIHNHADGNHWSGVYYVDAEDGTPGVYQNGALWLPAPLPVPAISGPGRFGNPERHLPIQPKNGLMVIFPSWMYHYVRVFRGHQRISISFNCKVELSLAEK